MTEDSRFGQGELETGCDDTASPNMEAAKTLLDYIMKSKLPPLKLYERQHLSEYLSS